MKVWVKKTLQGLIPASRTEEEELQSAKYKVGEYYLVDIKKPRNVKFHRKFFSLINIAFENEDNFDNIDEFRAYVTMRAGFYKRIVTDKGEFYLPKSISFAKMDDVEFSDLYDKVFAFIIELLDCTNDELMDALGNF